MLPSQNSFGLRKGSNMRKVISSLNMCQQLCGLIISVILIYVCFFVVNLLFYAHRISILGHIVIWMTDCGLWGGITLFSLQAAFVQSRERFIDWKLYDKSSLFIFRKRLKKQLSTFNINIKYLQSIIFLQDKLVDIYYAIYASLMIRYLPAVGCQRMFMDHYCCSSIVSRQVSYFPQH